MNAATSTSPGWHARLDLQFDSVRDGTVLTRRRHQGPLLVQRSFHPEGAKACHVYVVHPPGGVASGDMLSLRARLTPGSHALLTTPAAGKYYRRGEAGVSSVEQDLRVDDATLEWLPQESILYPDAEVQLRSVVRLSSNARFIGWEIACLGLPSHHRSLERGSLRLDFELWHEDRPVLLERLALSGAALTERWGLAGYNSLGTAVFYPAHTDALSIARAALPENCAQMLFACTLVDGALICRALSQRADLLRQTFVQLWRKLRPPLLGAEAVLPRIWNT